jgi:hypothetical protein
MAPGNFCACLRGTVVTLLVGTSTQRLVLLLIETLGHAARQTSGSLGQLDALSNFDRRSPNLGL